MQAVNIFHKGLITDLDVSKRSSDCWDLPSINCRIINRDGQWLIVTNVNGNECNTTTGKGFALPIGYLPIGSCEYDGIAYILSIDPNSIDSITGLCTGELGTFPSPKSITSYSYITHTATYDNNITGFERVYKPLINFEYVSYSGDRSPFRTLKFTLSKTKLGDIFARSLYDQTVNLYICDGLNFNRVINTGFNKNTGLQSTERKLYNDNSFPYYISQIPLTATFPRITSVVIEQGGKWKSGHTWFYIRYVNEDFGRTQFLNEVGPIAVHKGLTSAPNNIEGITGIPGESGIKDQSDKRIKFNVSLDIEYKYYEIAFIRYFGDDLNIPVKETGLLGKYYNITSSTDTVVITGYETIIPITEAEIIEPSITDLTCESHTQVDNKYYGVNWKSVDKHNDYLVTYAEKIEMHYDDSYPMLDWLGYKDPLNILDKVGYGRTETYPYGIRYILKGNIHTDTYPVKGYDEYNACNLLKGIYRFPDIHHSPLMINMDNFQIMGIKFDNLNSRNWLIANPTINTWFNNNVIGFYYVRGPRYKNLLYQGLTLYGCTSYVINNDDGHLQNYEPLDIQRNELYAGGVHTDFPLPADCSDKQTGWGTGNQEAWLVKNGEWAEWVGAFHKNLWSHNVGAHSDSDYWGANRDNNELSIDTCGEGNYGFKDKIVHVDAVFLSWSDRLVMPIWKGLYPAMYLHFQNDENSIKLRHHMLMSYYDDIRMCLISPEYCFDLYPDVPHGSILYKIARTFNKGVFDYYEEDSNGEGRDTTSCSGFHSRVYPWWTYADLNHIPSYDIWLGPYNDVKYSLIDKYITPTNAKSSFVSEYTDAGFEPVGFYQTGTCMEYWSKYGNNFQGGSNRSMSTCRYIGLTFTKPIDLSMLNRGYVNIYKEDIAMSASTTESKFDLYTIPYSRIHNNYYLVTDNTNNIIHYKGDCFLQRTYIKVMGWRGTTALQYTERTILDGTFFDTRDTFGNDDDQPLIYAGHGLVVEVVSENFINTSMRHSFEKRTFYPKEISHVKFAAIYPDNNESTESFLLNIGYNITQPSSVGFAYNDNLPSNTTEYRTRIRFSDTIVESGFVDGFRTIKELNKKDYSNNYGDMIRIFNYNGSLISIQEKIVSLHITGEREATIQSDEGSIILGDSKELSQKVRMLGSCGLQHKWGCVQTDKGIYFWDWNKRTLNKIGYYAGDKNVYLDSKPISNEKLSSKWIYDIIEAYSQQSDVSNILDDTPLLNIGLTMGYDRKYGDVVFTYLNGINSRTLVFNEDIDAFTFEYSYKSPFYLTINNDFYSVFYENSTTINKFYFHDSEVINKTTFYGTQYDFQLSFYINGLNEQQNTVYNSKVYYALEIEMSKEGLTQVDYSTLNQTGSYTGFSSTDVKFWLAPEYTEGKWKLPIQAQTNPTSPFYTIGVENMIDSYMRGEYMKIILTGRNNNSIFIKNCICEYELSQF